MCRPTTYLFQSANSCIAACYVVSMLQVNCFMSCIAEILSVVNRIRLCSFAAV